MFSVMIYVIGAFITFCSIKFFNKKVESYDKISLRQAFAISMLSWFGSVALACILCIVFYEKLKENGKLDCITNLYRKANTWFEG